MGGSIGGGLGSDGRLRMPTGPLFTSKEGVLTSFYTEVITKRADVEKRDTLAQISQVGYACLSLSRFCGYASLSVSRFCPFHDWAALSPLEFSYSAPYFAFLDNFWLSFHPAPRTPHPVHPAQVFAESQSEPHPPNLPHDLSARAAATDAASQHHPPQVFVAGLGLILTTPRPCCSLYVLDSCDLCVLFVLCVHVHVWQLWQSGDRPSSILLRGHAAGVCVLD